MQADRSRLGRWAQMFLVLGTVFVASTFPITAFADDEDEEEEDEDDGEEEEEEDDEADPQPPVTAGGLFTKETYPVSEIERPLTITGGMTELRLGLDVDLSAGEDAEGNANAFSKFGVGVDARHGFADNVEGQFHLRSDLTKFTSFVAEGAVEAGIVYDLVDFRLALRIPVDKTVDTAGVSSTNTRVTFPIGFPFRYAVKPQVALIALDTFMTINTDAKPDLTPSVGVIVQPLPMLAIKLHATLIIKEFNTDEESGGGFVIPVSLDIQFSPNNKFDIGGEFTFPNLKPPGDPAPAFYDNRMLLIYGQIRI